MPYIPYPCWACQSIASEQAKCRICSPRPLRKSRLRKPRNTERPQRLYTVAAATLTRLYKLHNYNTAAIQEDICTMTEDEPFLEHNIPALTIIPHNPPWTIPSIVLHGAENEHPTMDIDTFNNVGKRVENTGDLRVLLCRPRSSRKHKWEKRCKKCYETAWANVYFACGIKSLNAGVKRTDKWYGTNKSDMETQWIRHEDKREAAKYIPGSELETMIADLDLNQERGGRSTWS